MLPALLACADPPPAPDPHAAAAPCEGCHAAEHAAWAGSHHALAHGPLPAAAAFDGVARVAGTLTATPLLHDGAPAFLVSDAAGARTLPAVSAIGVAPLRQVVLDAGAGRRLVAPLAWDGARWFDPAPGGAVGDPADPLYWAGLAGTWNHQCAPCHTTGFTKGFDPATATYTSTTTHDVVACVACHGTTASPLTTAAAQLDTCGACHARRRPLTCDADPGAPLLDRFRPALLDGASLAADGRLAPDAEPFEWAPFVRSRMAAAGVRCTDCHDPHSGRLAREGDALCTGCHTTLPAEHESGCVGCHMPTTTYMTVHARHDHGLHRPGDPGRADVFGPALAGGTAAAPALAALALDGSAPAFDRASALALLRGHPPTEPTRLRLLAHAPDALVRAEAVATLGAWGDAETARVALADPVRAVRFAAIEAFVVAGGDVAGAREAYTRVLAEVEALGACEDDLPSTHQNLGRLRAAAGDRAGALAAFQTLLRLDPESEAARRALDALTTAPSP